MRSADKTHSLVLNFSLCHWQTLSHRRERKEKKKKKRQVNSAFCGLYFRLGKEKEQPGFNVDVGLQVLELHKLKEGACLLGKDHLAQGLNTTSVLGPSRPAMSQLSSGCSGMHKAV